MCWSMLAQQNFNKIFGECGESLSSYELLYYDTESYYAIGYYDDDFPGLGIRLSRHDKKSGTLVDSIYFGYNNRILFTGGRAPVYFEDNHLLFAIEGNNFILKLSYDI